MGYEEDQIWALGVDHDAAVCELAGAGTTSAPVAALAPFTASALIAGPARGRLPKDGLRGKEEVHGAYMKKIICLFLFALVCGGCQTQNSSEPVSVEPPSLPPTFPAPPPLPGDK